MQLILGACGYLHNNLNKRFYPEDLPEDWRLAYYANEFESVLVPESDWLEYSNDQWSDLVQELDDNFLILFIASASQQRYLKGITDKFINIPVILVDFSNDNRIFDRDGVIIEQANVLLQGNFSKSVCILRVSARHVINPVELKQLLQWIQIEFNAGEQVCLYFDAELLDIDLLEKAKIIAGLL